MQLLRSKPKIAASLDAGLSLVAVHAQVVLTGTSYSQNFNGLTAAGLPTGRSVSTLSNSDFGFAGNPKPVPISTGTDRSGTFDQTTGTVWNSPVAASPGWNFGNVASPNAFRAAGFGAWGSPPLPTGPTQQSTTDRALAVGLDAVSPLTGGLVLKIADTVGYNNFKLSYDYENLNSISKANGITLNVYYALDTPRLANSFAPVGTTVRYGSEPGWKSVSVALPAVAGQPSEQPHPVVHDFAHFGEQPRHARRN